jgi:D-glycero-D-manno-heptose 1,7-bisphosphate phosphatase
VGEHRRTPDHLRCMKRAVFLDRDGVLARVILRNGRPSAPTVLEEFEIDREAVAVLPTLRAAGFLLIVVTNQPDVARGCVRREVVEAMHRLLQATLPLDDVKVCWEVDSPANMRYKPKPGLLLEAAREHGIDLGRSFMVGDRWRDVGAGRAAGCFTVLIDRAYAEPMTETPDAVCADLAGAAVIILDHAQHAGDGRSG